MQDTRIWVGVGALFVAATILWPFTQGIYLPLIDLPNHIARHTIMASGNEGPLSTYYTSQFVLVPNSAVDLLWRILGYPGDAVVFSHRVMAFSALNLFASAVVLARVVHGRWTLWSLAAGLMAFNCTFLFGFQNYSFSLPFAIYGFALYLALEKQAIWLRAAVFLALTPILFLMHFFAFAVLGALAFGREAQKLVEGRSLSNLGQGAIMALPFVLPVIWLLVDMTTGPENPAGSRTSMGTLGERVERLMTPLYSWATEGAEVMNVTAMLVVIGLYVLLATTLIPRVGLKIAPVMRGPMVVLVALVMLAPDWLSGVAWIGIRFSFVFILVCIAASTWQSHSMQRMGLLACVVIAALGVRSAQMGEWFDGHDADMRDLAAVMDAHVAPGDRVLPVRSPGQFEKPRHWHVHAYATAHRDAFIPTLFQGVHAVQLRDEWADHATPLMHANPACAVLKDAPAELYGTRALCRTESYLENWPTKFTKLIAMEPLSEELVANTPVTLLGQVGRYQAYEIHNQTVELQPGQ